jgi:hypothetical protein
MASSWLGLTTGGSAAIDDRGVVIAIAMIRPAIENALRFGI